VLKKRSLTIRGHRTSIALEPEFWDGLAEMAAARNNSLTELIISIDETRTGGNLSSALRVAVLAYFRERPQPQAGISPPTY
jgi:predicted DNA-binding ribbon-helix-helix protein